MKRRDFLTGVGAAAVISTMDWLRYFKSFGVPGTAKTLHMAEAVAASRPSPRYLIYWFLEGGWDGYSMFNPVTTHNDATLNIPAGSLNPSPAWGNQTYRPKGWGTTLPLPSTVNGVTSGYLATGGRSLFKDLAVMSSHYGLPAHSKGRLQYHYGDYGPVIDVSANRAPNERSVLQAFCEHYGASYVLPHISWHLFTADPELNAQEFQSGLNGYCGTLGPAYAHTIYGHTPALMRQRLAQIKKAAAPSARNVAVQNFVDDLQKNFIQDKNSDSVAAFASAVGIYKDFIKNGGNVPTNLFADPTNLEFFDVSAADQTTISSKVEDNKVETKNTPATNCQAMMTWEMMSSGLSCGFWIESQVVRAFDSHESRANIFKSGGTDTLGRDQGQLIQTNLWKPLAALVDRLKNTQDTHDPNGNSYWNNTTIVICSEMGRTMGSKPDPKDSYNAIMSADSCGHNKVSSFAMLGGNVKPGQWGKVTTVNPGYDAWPINPDGSLDTAYNPQTGNSSNNQSFVTDYGHLYATALYASGINPKGIGKNVRPPLTFMSKSG